MIYIYICWIIYTYISRIISYWTIYCGVCNSGTWDVKLRGEWNEGGVLTILGPKWPPRGLGQGAKRVTGGDPSKLGQQCEFHEDDPSNLGHCGGCILLLEVAPDLSPSHEKWAGCRPFWLKMAGAWEAGRFFPTHPQPSSRKTRATARLTGGVWPTGPHRTEERWSLVDTLQHLSRWVLLQLSRLNQSTDISIQHSLKT